MVVTGSRDTLNFFEIGKITFEKIVFLFLSVIVTVSQIVGGSIILPQNSLRYINMSYLSIFVIVSFLKYFNKERILLKDLVKIVIFLFSFSMSIHNMNMFEIQRSNRLISVSIIVILLLFSLIGNSFISEFLYYLLLSSVPIMVFWALIYLVFGSKFLMFYPHSLNLIGLRISESVLLFNLFLTLNWKKIKTSWKAICILLEAVAFLALSSTISRGALMVAFLSAIYMIIAINSHHKRRIFRLFIVIIILGLITTYFVYSVIFISNIKNINGTMLRLKFIKYTLDETFSKTSTALFGRGPGITGASIFLHNLSLAQGYPTANAHNGFIDTISQFGIIGTVWLVLIISQVIIRSLFKYDTKIYAIFYLISLLYGISETAFFGQFSYLGLTTRLVILARLNFITKRRYLVK